MYHIWNTSIDIDYIYSIYMTIWHKFVAECYKFVAECYKFVAIGYKIFALDFLMRKW
jgi:hypothetical protein